MINATPNTFLMINGRDGNAIKIDYLELKKSSMILRALNHNLRQSMLKLLEQQTRLTVTEIYIQLRLEQSVASQHLAILRRAGTVKTIREGKYIYYELHNKRLDEIRKCVVDLLA